MSARSPIYASRLIPDGTYTVVGVDGRNCTIDIADAPWASEPDPSGRYQPKPIGTRTAGLLIGPNNSRDFMKFAFVLPDGEIIPMKAADARPIKALRALLTDSDPAQYGFLYASASGRCFRCGRKLTVESSLIAGMGPDCADIVGEWFAARRENAPELPAVPTQVRAPETVAAVAEHTAPEQDDDLQFADGVITCRLRWGCRGFEDKKSRLKGLGFRWDGTAKVWQLRIDATHAERIADDLGSFVSWPAIAAEIEALTDRAVANIEASRAASADFAVAGITTKLTLRPFQVAGIQYITTQRNLIVADSMGLGKTCEAIASAAHLGLVHTLAIVPSSQKLNWRREIKMWAPTARVIVIGSKPVTAAMIAWSSVVVINYEQLDQVKHPWLMTTPWDGIICDEAHMLKQPKSLRTKRTKAICDQARSLGSMQLAVMLTGTPVLNRPVELYSLLEIIGREDAVGGYWQFVKRYCGAHQEEVWQKNKQGKAVKKLVWNTGGATNMVELHDRLRANGVFLRRLKEDVLSELPAKTWATVPVAMSARGEAEYLRAEEDAVAWMYAQDSRLAKLTETAKREADKAGISPEERISFIAGYIAERRDRSQAVAQLTRFAGLKQAAWEAKRDAALQWMDEFVDGSDRKLVVFAHHIATVNEVAERYDAPKIQGGMTVEAVEEGKARFQNDPACRVIVCNLQAGGVGHTLTAASDVCFLELPWTPALLDQAVDRCHRIGQRNAVTGWILAAERSDGEETIDGVLSAVLAGKRSVVDAVTDGVVDETSDTQIADLVAGTLLARA